MQYGTTSVERAPQGLGTFFPPVSDMLRTGGVLSPYFQRSSLQEIGTGGNTNLFLVFMKAIITSCGFNDNNNMAVQGNYFDGSGVFVGFFNANFDANAETDPVTLVKDAINSVVTEIGVLGYTIASSDVLSVYSNMGLNAVAVPSTYQTVVSQTGTSAPAVSGSLTPMSTYPSGTTFTWARSSAGVYTLTASTAVFTAGKTAVVVGGLNNLNASYKAVVTSSTVITLTTAIGSLLGLGLLGFTATNTDALLTQTGVTVNTYA